MTYTDGGGFPGGPWTSVHFTSQTHHSYIYTTLIDANIAQRSGRWGPQRVTVPIDAKAGQLLTTVTATSPTTRVTVQAPEVRVSPTSGYLYMAMGDSYSSGEGNPPFDPRTDVPAPGDSCHRSVEAWPYKLAAQDSNFSFSRVDGFAPDHIACSGAKMENITPHAFKAEPSQLSVLKRMKRKTDVITLTIGGNDVGFQSVLTNCVGAVCVGDGTLVRANSYINTELQGKLVQTLQAIKAEAPNAHIVLVGYPRIFTTSAWSAVRRCPTWVQAGDARALTASFSALAQNLDTVEAAAARQAGVSYVSTLDAFKGHELCTAHSYVRSLTQWNGGLYG